MLRPFAAATFYFILRLRRRVVVQQQLAELCRVVDASRQREAELVAALDEARRPASQS
jgi:hypothetical protein